MSTKKVKKSQLILKLQTTSNQNILKKKKKDIFFTTLFFNLSYTMIMRKETKTTSSISSARSFFDLNSSKIFESEKEVRDPSFVMGMTKSLWVQLILMILLSSCHEIFKLVFVSIFAVEAISTFFKYFDYPFEALVSAVVPERCWKTGFREDCEFVSRCVRCLSLSEF